MEIAMDKETTPNLVALSDTNRLQVAEGDPDVRGWRVLSADRRELGKVSDLLLDPVQMRVRYLVVKLDDVVSHAKDRKVLLPIGTAELDRADDRVLLDATAGSMLADLPPYDGRTLSREYEDWLAARLGADRTAVGALYDREQFDDNRFYGTRRRITEAERRIRKQDDVEVDRRLLEADRIADVREVGEGEVREREADARAAEARRARERDAETVADSARRESTTNEIRVPVAPGEEVTVTRTGENGDVIIRKQAQEEAEERLRRRIEDERTR
jgi:photosynthetic reaction center H subunit